MARKKKVEEVIIESIKEEKIKEIPDFYVLKIGETIEEVAKKFGIKKEDIVKLNGEVIGTNQVRLK